MEPITLAARFVLGILFGLAGLSKLVHRREFADAAARYGLIPSALVTPVALLLPIVELTAGLALLLGLGTRLVAAVLGVMLVAFTAAVVVALARGQAIDCGCFGAAVPQRLTWRTVGRNVFLFALALGVAVEAEPSLALDSLLVDARSSASTADAFATALAVTMGLLAVGLARAALRLRGATRRSGDPA